MLFRIIPIFLSLLFVLCQGGSPAFGQAAQTYDVVVLGATPAGVAAAIAAARLGRKTALLGDAQTNPAPAAPSVFWLKGRVFHTDNDSSLALTGDMVSSIKVINAHGETERYEGQVFIDATAESQLLETAGDRLWIPTEGDKSATPTQPNPDGPLLAFGNSRSSLVSYSTLLPDTLTNLFIVGRQWANEPDQAVMGHAAGVAAAISLKQKVVAPMVEVRQVQAQLLEDSVLVFPLEDLAQLKGKAWAGAQLIGLYIDLKMAVFKPETVMPPRLFEIWWPSIFPSRGAPGPIFQPANRRDAAETVWQFFRGTYLNPKPKALPGKKGKKRG